MGSAEVKKLSPGLKTLKRSINLHWELYLILIVPVSLTVLFHYVPIYGVQIAFREFRPTRGIWGSEWVGLKYFKQFVSSPAFWRVVGNTLRVSLSTMVISFPFPILLAIMLNEARVQWFKRTVQMATYAPYFISTVVLSGIVLSILDVRVGLVNHIISAFGFERIQFMARPSMFLPAYITSSIWQGTGYSSVIYIAALTAISPELHEAAIADGASRLKRLWHIDLPGIIPTITILTILSFASVISVGFERVFTLQNDINRASADVISTYTYRLGIQQRNYSFTTAVGFTNSLVNTFIFVSVNQLAKKFGETSLW